MDVENIAEDEGEVGRDVEKNDESGEIGALADEDGASGAGCSRS